jgi:hypothetical protein
VSKGVPSTAEPIRNRCRCGHFASPHLKVVPAAEGSVGNFALVPSGPCAICGAEACPRFAPVA